MCVWDMLLFALAKKSGPEHTVGDSNNWVMVLLSDRELFTRKILSRNWIAFISLFKVCSSLFTSFSKGSIYAISECVNILHLQSHGRCLLPVLWFSSSQRVPVRQGGKKKKKPAFILLILFGMHFLTSPSPGQSSGLCWCLQGHLGISSDPFSLLFLFSLLWYPPLNFQLNRNADGHISF